MKSKIMTFVKSSVEWLQEKQEGCCTYKLDDHLAVCIGWSAGYGEEERDDVIQAKDNLDYGINVGIKVWTSDDLKTDFDWINFPYYDDGEVLDMSLGIALNEDYNQIVASLLEWYNEVKNIVMENNGRILIDKRYPNYKPNN